MEKVEFSKCIRCEKIKHTSNLESAPNLIGLVCIDKDICAKNCVKIEIDLKNEE
jgi:hypothetical protein